MKSWNYQPAKDIELKPVERARSLRPPDLQQSSLRGLRLIHQRG